ncbi:MAG: AGE family epimerase/isomerase [Candidatus Hinthialibacter sp.]
MKDKLNTLRSLYQKTLYDDVIPFWLNHSIDEEFGGYFTCLNRDGEVFETDKFLWLQARQVWMLSHLYNHVEQNPAWLQAAQCGADFLQRRGRDEEGNWYFSLDREGRPLVQPYNLFSDCFAAMAFSQYAQAAGCSQSQEIALSTFQNILKRLDNPKGKYNKLYPGTRPLKALAFPMILSNLCVEMEDILDPTLQEETVSHCLDEIINVFLDRDRLLLYEHRAPDGSKVDHFEGRISIPGHGIEAMWFLMDVAQKRNDRKLIDLCVDTMLSILKFGWDPVHEGVFYFLDLDQKPPQQLEWDQKLWWVHLESLIALLMGFRLTGRQECWTWFEKVHAYSWSHFSDPEYGEWYGYLNRRGEVFLPLKGGKWKGCFHVPRALHRCSIELDRLARNIISDS